MADPLQVEAATGMVYVPEFSKVEFDAGYLQAACLSGGNVYLVGDAIQESETEGPTVSHICASCLFPLLSIVKPSI